MHPLSCEIWYALLTPATVRRARRLEGWLSDEERRRAARYRQPRDGDLYLVAHVLLRDLLGQATGRRPEDLQFTSDPGGKPQLVDRGLQFNLSHTRGAVLAAVGGAPLGVDIEFEDRQANLDIARRFFSPPEYQRLHPLPPAARRREFFQIWTLKEAWLKARGSGLAEPLDAFRVDADPSTQTARVTYLDAARSQRVDAAWLRTGRIPLPADAPAVRRAEGAEEDGAFRWSLAVLAEESAPGGFRLREWPLADRS